MNVDISETIEDREMGSQIYIEKWDLRFKSRSLVRSASMPKTENWALRFRFKKWDLRFRFRALKYFRFRFRSLVRSL